MNQIVGRSVYFRVAAIGAVVTRRVPIPVQVAIMLAYTRDKWSCDRPGKIRPTESGQDGRSVGRDHLYLSLICRMIVKTICSCKHPKAQGALLFNVIIQVQDFQEAS